MHHVKVFINSCTSGEAYAFYTQLQQRRMTPAAGAGRHHLSAAGGDRSVDGSGSEPEPDMDTEDDDVEYEEIEVEEEVEEDDEEEVEEIDEEVEEEEEEEEEVDEGESLDSPIENGELIEH